MGNIQSVQNAVERVGGKVGIVTTGAALAECEGLVARILAAYRRGLLPDLERRDDAADCG